MARILVIDDDDGIRLVMQKLFENGGHEVIAACDGQEGIDLYREQPIELVITDYQMPRKNGLEVLEELRAKKPDVRVLIMTSYAGDLLKETSIVDEDQIIEKPFTLACLLGAVEELLNG